MPELKQNRTCIAVISDAHGIRGDLKIRVYLTHPEDMSRYNPIFFEDGSEFLLNKIISSLNGSVIVSTKTIKDRDAALKLRGQELYVMRDQLPDLDDDGTYYYTDLIGLSVQNESGAVVGLVKYVHDYGAGTILEIVDFSAQQSVLVPFQNEAVPVVELGSHLVIRDQYLTDLHQE